MYNTEGKKSKSVCKRICPGYGERQDRYYRRLRNAHCPKENG
jgi:hypothetical protein